MSTKSELLKLLESHRGEYLSGEELALRLGYSRTAVESHEEPPSGGIPDHGCE